MNFRGGLRREGEVENDHCVSWASACPTTATWCYRSRPRGLLGTLH